MAKQKGLTNRNIVLDRVCKAIKIMSYNKVTLKILMRELNVSYRVARRYIEVLSMHFLVNEEWDGPGQQKNGHRYWIEKGNGRIRKLFS